MDVLKDHILYQPRWRRGFVSRRWEMNPYWQHHFLTDVSIPTLFRSRGESALKLRRYRALAAQRRVKHVWSIYSHRR
jgi:hypothetical protein